MALCRSCQNPDQPQLLFGLMKMKKTHFTDGKRPVIAKRTLCKGSFVCKYAIFFSGIAIQVQVKIKKKQHKIYHHHPPPPPPPPPPHPHLILKKKNNKINENLTINLLWPEVHFLILIRPYRSGG